MAWIDLHKLSVGLSVDQTNSDALADKVRSAFPDAGTAAATAAPQLVLLIDLNKPVLLLDGTEHGSYKKDGNIYETLIEETFAQCGAAEGWSLLSYLGKGMELDNSKGIELDSNRYHSSSSSSSGGHHLDFWNDFLNGDFSVEQLTETQTKLLRAVAEKLGVPF